MLGFVDQKPYPERLEAARVNTGIRDAAVWGTGTISGTKVCICIMDFAFMGGSMGTVVGEKVTRAAEHALEERLPLIVVSASGGARMQEGTLSLMQLAKTVAALGRLADACVPYISVMTDPTTGGVFASFAALGDVNLAEPDALIGFAGARVAAGTISESLPEGFQRAEFLFEHGFVDMVVARPKLRETITGLLRYLRAPDRRQDRGQRQLSHRPFDGLSRDAHRPGAGSWLSRRQSQPQRPQRTRPFQWSARKSCARPFGRASSWRATSIGRTRSSCSAAWRPR